MSRTAITQLAAAGLIALAGLLSLMIADIWPLTAMAVGLTLLFRFRPATRAVGLVMEIMAVGLVVILTLSRLGLNVIFAYKAIIAVLLFALVLLERNGGAKVFDRWGRLYTNIRVSAVVSVIGVAVVALGHFVYRGQAFAMVRVPLEIMVLVGIGWALLNSISEEFIYRGLLYTRLKDTVGVPGALAGQAVIFAVAHHWTKVPMGIPGMVMSFLFALSLGWLVRKTGSLFAVIFAHFWVDLALFATVLLRQ